MKKIICLICLLLGISIFFQVFAASDTNQLLQQNLSATQDKVKQLNTQLQVV